jgi:phosphohistidine phosphatase
LKSVILFRHSKAVYPTKSVDDYERPLTEEGIEIAKKMGIYLSDIKIVPDLIISSSALRAKRTAILAKDSGQWNSEFKLEKRVYGGNFNFIINLLSNQSNNLDTICITGHEPHLSSFICKVSNENYLEFPVASIAKIDFMIDDWNNISFNNAIIDKIIKYRDILN